MTKIKPSFSYKTNEIKSMEIEIIRLYIRFFKFVDLKERIVELKNSI